MMCVSGYRVVELSNSITFFWEDYVGYEGRQIRFGDLCEQVELARTAPRAGGPRGKNCLRESP